MVQSHDFAADAKVLPGYLHASSSATSSGGDVEITDVQPSFCGLSQRLGRATVPPTRQ